MPKRLYSFARTQWELSRVRKRRGLVSTWKLDDAPVFEFLEAKLSSKPVGARATYKKDRKDGKSTHYVYEKSPRGYLLVERKNYNKEGKLAGSTPPKEFKVGRKKRGTRRKYEYDKK